LQILGGWQELPQTNLQSVCPPDNFGGDTYSFSQCGGVIGAWSGGILDEGRNRLILWGGGHADYSGNELYALNLGSSPASLVRLNDPTVPTVKSPDCPESMPDGKPNARHTYGSLVYLPQADRMFAYGGALVTECKSVGTWTLDLATLTWQRMDPVNGAIQPKDYGGGTVVNFADYDPTTGLVFLTNLVALFTYEYSTNTYAFIRNFSIYNVPAYSHGVIDPKRRIFFFFGPNGPPPSAPYVFGIHLAPGSSYDLENLTSQVSGCDALASAPAPGLTYDSARDKIIGWPNFGNTVYIFDPDTLTCTAETHPGGPPDSVNYSNQPASNGTYGRFRYVPKLQAFVLVNFWKSDAYLLGP
jgi:hypothetical protein